jgi:arginine decarboxylase-like protein
MNKFRDVVRSLYETESSYQQQMPNELLMDYASQERESMLEYLYSVQEYLDEEQDEKIRAQCIREVFQEIRHSSRPFAHNLAQCMVQSCC